MKQFISHLEAAFTMGGIKKDIILLIISGISLLFSLFHWSPFSLDIAWVAIILCGIPIIMEAIIGLIQSFDIKADVLVSLALIASVAIGETFAAGEVAFIMQLGSLLETLTVAKAKAGIENLVQLTPLTARVIDQNKEQIVPVEQVQTGDHLRVLPGENIPVDGIILSGETSINQAIMTGESLPVDKAPGDPVFSGTINQFGVFEMSATKVGEDSSIQRMIRLIQSADAGKAKIVGIADRWATWIVVIALIAASVTWLMTGEIIRAITILVVFCPCALVLATPCAIMAAIGNVTKHGFLVREGDALERLASVQTITFDKTGTLTNGIPQVVKIKSYNDELTNEQLYSLIASSEQLSEHPLGKAIVTGHQQSVKNPLSPVKEFQMFPGQGISAMVDGKTILAGNFEMMKKCRQEGIPQHSAEIESCLKEGCSIIYITIDTKFSGFIALSDTLRSESPAAIAQLNALGIHTVLLTGDHDQAAYTIGSKSGIKEIHPNCLPEEKLQYIENCQNNGNLVCMIGDGINDAPALKKAAVGIAMGKIGSDIAVDAADIALVNDEIKELPHLFALSKQMMKTIKGNLTFSMLLNFIAIILAITGILNPVIGALVHNAGSVLVIINSALLLKWKRRTKLN